MTHEDFKKLLNELDGQGAATLAEKNARYSSTDDALHNFKLGAEIAGGTPAQACWGYMTKHLVALRDMVARDDFSNKDDLLEKCQDVINYVRFIWAIGNEKLSNQRNRVRSAYTKYQIGNDNVQRITCIDCKYFLLSDNDEPCSKCQATSKNDTEYYSRSLLWTPNDYKNGEENT